MKAFVDERVLIHHHSLYFKMPDEHFNNFFKFASSLICQLYTQRKAKLKPEYLKYRSSFFTEARKPIKLHSLSLANLFVRHFMAGGCGELYSGNKES
jgi:hypothetical protein